MGYNKTNWVNGDVITAEKLNNMEDGISNSENGYSVIEEEAVLFEDSITTISGDGGAVGTITLSIDSMSISSIIVTIDGVEYELPRMESLPGYGEWSGSSFVFDNYPCAIMLNSGSSAYFITEEAGTYQVKIEYSISGVQVSEIFTNAVNEVVLKSPLTISLTRGVEESDITVSSTSWSVILEAFDEGQDIVLFDGYFNRYLYPISFTKSSGQDISSFCYINCKDSGDGTLSEIEIYNLYNHQGYASLSYSSGSLS